MTPTAQRRIDPLDSALLVVLVACLGASALVVEPGVGQPLVSTGLDTAEDTASCLITLLVAALSWARFRELGGRPPLFRAAAFLVLAAANGFSLALLLTETGSAPLLAQAGQEESYVTVLARLTAAAFILVGSTRWATRPVQVRRPESFSTDQLILLATAACLTLAVAIGLQRATFTLPELVRPGSPSAGVPSMTLLGALLSLLTAGLFGWAAALERRGYQQSRATADGFLVVGFVFAAFAQLHYVLYPSVSPPGLVSSGDLFRLAFDAALLLGIQAEARATVAALRGANRTLERLKEAEGDRATVEERMRLWRELHDGLAQDLWLAKLKIGRVVSSGLAEAEAETLREVEGAIEAGLTEARQVVMALRSSDQFDSSFGELLRHYVDDFSDRFALRVELECEPELADLNPRAKVELLRIAQEALRNVHRHADATLVRVRVETSHDHLVLVVRDNGCGFDPGAVGDRKFGLSSMRERASLLGGRVTIESRPSDGAQVMAVIPLRNVLKDLPTAQAAD